MIIEPLGEHTYKDYLTYEENERIELIEGEIFNMAPAPSRMHQEIINELYYILNHHIKSNNGPCKVYTAPFDVILNDKDKDILDARSVVQPDISVKLTHQGCTGDPDMVVEVISPYNPTNDYVRKTYIYCLHGVKEYWIVNPMKETILVYILENDGYDMPATYTFQDTVKVHIFHDLEVDFSKLDL